MSQENGPRTPDPETHAPASPDPAAPADPAALNDAPRPGAAKISLTAKIFVVFFYAAIGVAVAWFAGAEEYLKRYWWAAAGVFAVGLMVALTPVVRRWVLEGQAQRRIGAIIVVSIFLILAFFCVVFLVDPDFQAAVLRLIFITVVCSLPAVMYYLFIATKKYSLLNELTINLRRLGLLEPGQVSPALRQTGLDGEGERERENRINTYVQKFESVYGSIPTDLGGFLLKPSDPSKSTIDQRISSSASGFTNIFTFDTVLPVLLATLLIALGWLITLPPWEGKFELGRLRGAVAAVAAETQSERPATGPAATGAGPAAAA
ncbi:MAG TPA: hypothetical protein VG148_17480, partial [Pyrinomonadaceae bacterium]|nr:hypothetical protein [Pyrinomonadaceae bacterium]